MSKLLPDALRNVRHLLPSHRPSPVQPIQELRHPVGRALPFLELLLQLLDCLRFNVALHAPKVDAFSPEAKLLLVTIVPFAANCPWMNRFYVEPQASREPLIELSERESHHALNVLRLKPGDRCAALNGQGAELLCQVEKIGKRQVTLRICQRNNIPPLPYQTTLIQALPKGKAMEFIIEKATELGAAHI